MFDTVVIATDGSESASRAVAAALDFAGKFDAAVHALSVVDEREVAGAPEDIRADLRTALESQAETAVEDVAAAAGGSVTTAVREGEPAATICQYAEDCDADVVAVGTRGRHGDHAFLLGSVAEAVLRRCSRPVMTIRQLDDLADGDGATAASQGTVGASETDSADSPGESNAESGTESESEGETA